MSTSDSIGVIGIVVGAIGTIVTIAGIMVALNQSPSINIENNNGTININCEIATSVN